MHLTKLFWASLAAWCLNNFNIYIYVFNVFLIHVNSQDCHACIDQEMPSMIAAPSIVLGNSNPIEAHQGKASKVRLPAHPDDCIINYCIKSSKICMIGNPLGSFWNPSHCDKARIFSWLFNLLSRFFWYMSCENSIFVCSMDVAASSSSEFTESDSFLRLSGGIQ